MDDPDPLLHRLSYAALIVCLVATGYWAMLTTGLVEVENLQTVRHATGWIAVIEGAASIFGYGMHYRARRAARPPDHGDAK